MKKKICQKILSILGFWYYFEYKDGKMYRVFYRVPTGKFERRKDSFKKEIKNYYAKNQTT